MSMHPAIEKTLRGHKDVVTAVCFNPRPPSLIKKPERGVQLASSSRDGTLTLWILPSESCPGTNKVSGGDARAYKFVGHSGPVHHVTYSPSGHLLASCSTDRTVRLWLPKPTGESVVLNGHSAAVRGVDFGQASNTGESLLLTCSDDKSLKVWTLPNKTFRSSLLGHTNWVRTCKLSPDTSNLAASGGDDKTLRLWDIERGENLITYNFGGLHGAVREAPGASVRNLSFHPFASSIAASGTDGCIRMYDLRSDALTHQFVQVEGDTNKRPTSDGPHLTSVDGLSFHPSGNYLLSSSADGSGSVLKLWDVRQGRMLYSFGEGSSEGTASAESGSELTSCVAFSADGTHFASSRVKDKEVVVWEMPNLRTQTGGDARTPHEAGQQTPYRHESPSAAQGRPSSRGQPGARRRSAVPTVSTRDYVIDDIIAEDTNLVDPYGRTIGGTAGATEPSTKQLRERRGREDDDDGSPPPADRCKEGQQLPELLAGTLDSIVSQLTLLTHTLQTFDRRLSLQEDALARLAQGAERERLPHFDSSSSGGTNSEGVDGRKDGEAERAPVEAKVREFLREAGNGTDDKARLEIAK